MIGENTEISAWFEEKIRINDAKLRAYLRQSESEPADVEDIVQEAYRRILEIRRKEDIRSPEGLLFRVAQNVRNDRLRKKYRANTISVGEIEAISDLSSDEDVRHEMEKAARVALLEEALRSLPRKCRQIMLLRTYENLSYKQIAARLDISVGTVETQLSRGLKKCKKYFKSKGYTC